MGRVVAIDGPSGVGKSTVAKLIAEMLGFSYLDTGALYRAVALGLRRAGVEPEASDDRIDDELRNIKVEFNGDKVYLNNEDVSMEIRTPEAGHYSSVFSARRPVREFLFPVQKDAAAKQDLVCEGRDMTTVVFPDAWKKFFLNASLDERAQRRYEQLRKSGVPVDMARATEDVVERDKRDSMRDIAPLKIAADALVVDSTDKTVEEVLKIFLDEIKRV